jgi:hypothetical protein
MTTEPRTQVKIVKNCKTAQPAELVISRNEHVYYVEECRGGKIEASRDPNGLYWAAYIKEARNIKEARMSNVSVVQCPSLESALSALDLQMAILYGIESPWCADFIAEVN